MPLIILMLLAYMILPIIGEITIFAGMYEVQAGEVNAALIFNNIIFVVLVFFAFLIISSRGKSTSQVAIKYPKRTMIRVNVLLILFAVFVFVMAGYKIYVLGMNTGQVRTSFGIFSLIYPWVTKYLTPALLLLSTLLYINTPKEERFSLLPWYITGWFLTLLIAAFTGYKSSIVTLSLPALSLIVFDKKFPLKLFLILPTFFILIISITIVVKDYPLEMAYYFILHRMTVMTAYGSIGVWNHFPEGASINEIMMLTYGLFGNNIASVLSGYDTESIEFLETNLSKLITYKAYPDSYGALTGTVNVTVTNFGEAWYIFNYFYPIYALIAGSIAGYVILKLKQSLIKGNICLAVCCMVYFYLVILPWFNSGNIFNLISLPSLVWIIGTYFVLLLIYRGKF